MCFFKTSVQLHNRNLPNTSSSYLYDQALFWELYFIFPFIAEAGWSRWWRLFTVRVVRQAGFKETISRTYKYQMGPKINGSETLMSAWLWWTKSRIFQILFFLSLRLLTDIKCKLACIDTDWAPDQEHREKGCNTFPVFVCDLSTGRKLHHRRQGYRGHPRSVSKRKTPSVLLGFRLSFGKVMLSGASFKTFLYFKFN